MAPYRRPCTRLAQLFLMLSTTSAVTPTPQAISRSCSSAPLAALELTAQASAGAVELSWTAAASAARYELLNLVGRRNRLATAGRRQPHRHILHPHNRHTGDEVLLLHPHRQRRRPDQRLAETVSRRHRTRSRNAGLRTPADRTPADRARTDRATQSVGAVELSWQAVQDAARYELLNWWDAEIGWQPLGG